MGYVQFSYNRLTWYACVWLLSGNSSKHGILQVQEVLNISGNGGIVEILGTKCKDAASAEGERRFNEKSH